MKTQWIRFEISLVQFQFNWPFIHSHSGISSGCGSGLSQENIQESVFTGVCHLCCPMSAHWLAWIFIDVVLVVQENAVIWRSLVSVRFVHCVYGSDVSKPLVWWCRKTSEIRFNCCGFFCLSVYVEPCHHVVSCELMHDWVSFNSRPARLLTSFVQGVHIKYGMPVSSCFFAHDFTLPVSVGRFLHEYWIVYNKPHATRNVSYKHSFDSITLQKCIILC